MEETPRPQSLPAPIRARTSLGSPLEGDGHAEGHAPPPVMKPPSVVMSPPADVMKDVITSDAMKALPVTAFAPASGETPPESPRTPPESSASIHAPPGTPTPTPVGGAVADWTLSDPASGGSTGGVAEAASPIRSSSTLGARDIARATSRRLGPGVMVSVWVCQCVSVW